MNKPKLKLVVSEPRSFAGVDFTKYHSEISKAQEEGHEVAILQYLHGKVCSKMGYDICACLNAEECADFDKELYKPGIYDVEVVGYENPCRAYLWNAGKNPRGLIVDISEPEDIEFAKEKYNKKECAL